MKIPMRYSQTNVQNEKSFKKPNHRGVPRGMKNPEIRSNYQELQMQLFRTEIECQLSKRTTKPSAVAMEVGECPHTIGVFV
jgi:hypothetical protein